MKKFRILLLIICMCLLGTTACDQKVIIDDETTTDSLEQLLSQSDIDLNALTDDELEIFISLVHEQGNIENLANEADGAISWESGEIKNRLGGDWYEQWSPLPDPHGDIIYQSLDESCYSALIKDYSLDELKQYIHTLTDLGFIETIVSNEDNEDFYSWQGEQNEHKINITLQNSSLWIEYLVS